MHELPTLTDAGDLSGARVLLRLGMNVPRDASLAVREPFRLEVLVPTLRQLKQMGARTLIIGHIGSSSDDSLRPVHDYLERALGSIRFVDHLPFDIAVLNPGDCALAENIRRYAGEAANDAQFAKMLARGADLYINEAFADSHRAHASIVSVPRLLPSYIGPWFEVELRELSRAFDPEHPFEVIAGGAKIATKIPLVQKFLTGADSVFVAGALANDIWKSRGYEMGRSLVSNGFDAKAIPEGGALVLPEDAVIERDGEVRIGEPAGLSARDSVMDIGPASLVRLRARVRVARTIVWNGPVGNTDGGYFEGTEAVAAMIADSAAHAIVGGGDTIAAISKLDAFDRFGFVSTGGGAMLDYLATETLPGIEAIREYWR